MQNDSAWARHCRSNFAIIVNLVRFIMVAQASMKAHTTLRIAGCAPRIVPRSLPASLGRFCPVHAARAGISNVSSGKMSSNLSRRSFAVQASGNGSSAASGLTINLQGQSFGCLIPSNADHNNACLQFAIQCYKQESLHLLIRHAAKEILIVPSDSRNPYSYSIHCREESFYSWSCRWSSKSTAHVKWSDFACWDLHRSKSCKVWSRVAGLYFCSKEQGICPEIHLYDEHYMCPLWDKSPLVTDLLLQGLKGNIIFQTLFRVLDGQLPRL